jgi:eukaryotic-like serine/threonine-protein kinase
MKVGAFELRSIIGRGAMAEVHRAVHQSQGVPVAVKVLDAEKAAAPRFQRMLYNEARAMAGLHHPGIAMVYDIGRAPTGSPWIAMEMASGGSLEDLVEVGLSWPDLKDLLLALLDALAHAHARGVLHRDLKPANILLCTEGDLRPGLKISDFGLAMPLDTGTGSSRISGTPAFMAPEQVRGLWRDFGPLDRPVRGGLHGLAALLRRDAPSRGLAGGLASGSGGEQPGGVSPSHVGARGA